MKLRTVLGGMLGGIGFAAVANRYLAGQAGSLQPPLSGNEATYRWRGIDVEYVEDGHPDDQDVLLLHGIHAAASSKEFDQIFDLLADDYHVIAPDLPGFGRSDRPDVAYSAELYTDFVGEFARDRTDDAICVASSLTASYAAIVQRDEAPFSRLELVCPTAETRAGWGGVGGLLRLPVVGTGLYNLLVSRAALRRFNERDAYYSPASYTEDELEYEWRTAHQPGARFPVAAFVGGQLDPDVNLGDVLAAVDVPITLIWGRDARITPVSEGRELAERADTKLIVFEEARLLPHAEHPGPFLEAFLDELAPVEQ
jgi:pimeloyl-ACP methyl ester carboxylesterase